tara:strand:- start:195 stop:923 length:729 start_codon:yes stop_codon:yes gene_type:complete
LYLLSKFKSKHILPILLFLGVVFIPFKGLFSNIFIFFARNHLHFSKDSYEDKIHDFEAKIAVLELRLKKFDSLREENNKLRKVLALKKAEKLSLLGVEVISFSPSNWRKYAIVNKGTVNKVEKGQFAIDEEGNLIGKIIEADKNTSRLLFADDTEFTASVFIGSHTYGLLSGNLIDAKVLYVEDGAGLKIDDKVWMRIPASNLIIDIGVLKRVSRNENSLFWDIEVKLNSNNFLIEKAFIIQ